MQTITTPKLEVLASPNHPSSVSSGEKKNNYKFANYKDWNSVDNIKRFIGEHSMATTNSGVLLINKEAPYSEEIDFMTLIDLPPFIIEIYYNGEKYIFKENDTLEQVIEKLGNSEIEINYDGNKTDKLSLGFKKNINYLEQKYPGSLINLIAKTRNGNKNITPETQVYELCPTSWGDLEKMEETEKKKDIQKLITSFINNNTPEQGKSLAAGFNYTNSRINGTPTGKDGGEDSQSLKDLHIHFFQIDGAGEKVKLSKNEDLAFHDYYISNAFKKHGFEWGNINFETLKTIDSKKNPLNKQGIIFEVTNFGTNKFWEEFDTIIGVIEDLNINSVSLKDLKLNEEKDISVNVDEILSKLSYNNDKYNEIIDGNRKLFKSIVEGIISRESEVNGNNRKLGSGLLPFPNFGYTLSLEKNSNGKIELKILPRIHTRGAVVEALGLKLERNAAESEEEFKKIMSDRKKTNLEIINNFSKDVNLQIINKEKN